jgi:hypothetical protein
MSLKDSDAYEAKWAAINAHAAGQDDTPPKGWSEEKQAAYREAWAKHRQDQEDYERGMIDGKEGLTRDLAASLAYDRGYQRGQSVDK